MTAPLAFILVVSMAGVAVTSALAQQPSQRSGPGPAFEVATVKPSPPPEPNPFGFPPRPTFRIEPSGRVIGQQMTLRDLVRRAYDLPDFLIAGGPPWMGSDRFELIAKAPADAVRDNAQVQRMLRALLEERFKLRSHTLTRDAPVYHLVLAKRDNSLGPNLRRSAIDCAVIRAQRGAAEAQTSTAEPTCRPSFNVANSSMTLGFQGETMAELARRVIPERDRPVIDKTGLPGTFDGEITFAPEPLPGFPRLPGSENGISLVTALQEQLGLKLAPERGMVEVLVVDSAEKPAD